MTTNRLIKESSLYLQQHAHNPVDWYPWSEEAFELAKKENKLVLVSIGYSACHWCHVMEKECFEDNDVAAYMNAHFVNIKVDREERPDVDQVYMTAVQLMTQKGGWPLNCFTLPAGRPLYGGTYFPNEQWLQILRSLVHTKEKDPQKVEEYATRLQEGIAASELIDLPQEIEVFSEEKLHETVVRWARSFDTMEGGSARAPKFPLPNNYAFLLGYAQHFQDEKVARHVELTLDKMCRGGIYDQIGGGFARYSVDMLWKVPHFEKMLYDNGQLIQLYSKAYRSFKKEEYKKVVYQTFDWLEREMSAENGAFYSALDADSEGEEGKFYCWEPTELKSILGDDYAWAKDYWNLNQRGFWEDEKYILLRTESPEDFAKQHKLDVSDFLKRLEQAESSLLFVRNQRIKPGKDTKALTSWNAMVLRGLVEAYAAFEDERFLLRARKCARWLLDAQCKADGSLYHNFANGVANIDGFLEDYAFTIDAFIALYQVNGELIWLEKAYELGQYVSEHFQHEESRMCYFTPKENGLIARKMELNDNVIPASNSMMAHNFLKLGHYFREDKWIHDAEQMLANVYDGMEQYGSGYSNWGLLLLQILQKTKEIVAIGYAPQDFLMVFSPENLLSYHDSIPQAQGHDKGIYVCTDGACLPPVESVGEMRDFIK